MFISKRADVKGFLEGEATILGPSSIGPLSLIGEHVIIGYPSKKKVILSNERSLQAYDLVSEGSIIGRECIIRSNTVIYECTELGEKVETGHGVLIREKSKIGDRTRIGTYTVIDGNVEIGRDNNIQTGVYIPPGTVIGSNVFIGPYVTVTNDKYPPTPKISGVVIEDGAVIGARAVLIAGVRIGRNGVVGAGAIVTKDVEPETVVIGVPARPVTSRKEYDKKQQASLKYTE